MRSIINANTKSYYSASVMKALEHYNRAAMVGYFGTYKHSRYSLDITKAYTRCLMDIPYFPAFTSFDEFMDYNGQINERAFYFIEILARPPLFSNYQMIFVNKKYEFVSGYVLQYLSVPYKILYQLTPQKFVKNTI